MNTTIILAALMLGALVLLFWLFTSWATRWGATKEECRRSMTGDAYLEGGPPHRVIMTRAISINQPPEMVWPWLAQLCRGAGVYSIDRLDNGGKISARHLVSWIPAPQLGDASPIGYLRHLDPGRNLVWWMGGDIFYGMRMRMVNDINLRPQDGGSRLVIRISGDAEGPWARQFIWLFRFVDSLMACWQLLGIKERVERYGVRTVDPDNPETGARDQYQLFEVIYASGERAGVAGRERAAAWRRLALEDGVIGS